MDERKRGGTNGGKRRPQSIEKMRRPSQSGQKKREPGRTAYSDGFSPRPTRPEEPRGRSVYKSDSEAERSVRRPPQKRPPVDRENDPHIKKAKTPRSRRTKQKRPVSRTKLRLRRFILSFAAISAVILIGVYLSLTVWFKTEKFRVEGETRYTTERIMEVCPINIGENIFLADKQNAAQTIKSALPYIESAEVRFSIPDTIIIKVTDAVPAYQIVTSDGYYEISSDGRILEKANSKLASVPTVECSGLENPDIGGYAEFSAESTPDILSSVVTETQALGIDNITVIDITNTSQVKLLYDDRILIIIGVPEDINYKLRTALAIINDKLDPNNSGVISGRLDVSVCNETKKSYFNENEIYTPPSQTQPSTAPSAQPSDPTDPSDTENTDPSDPEDPDDTGLSDPAEE